ncbi:GspH/FimT family pseudopilin [Salinispirillum sp. LH 10-3-1]|uniref:Type II secretion system protein H n=1 Tax=Salinispirillum sp. LH 10-3-1 TaxID=2952525 RepID=A0AB38YHU8_9GAMM
MKRMAGFNLLELMTTVAILGILASVAIAPLRASVERAQTRAAMSQVHVALKLGRQSAVYHQQLVTICPLDASQRCSNDWNRELTVFLDPFNLRAVTQEEQVIERFPGVAHGRLQAAPAWKSYFQFTSRGSSHGTLGHVRYCPDHQTAAARIVVNMSGRSRNEWLDHTDLPLSC